MLRLLARLSPRDWLVVVGGLALVAGIEMAKPPASPPLPDPVPVAALPPAPPGPPVTFPQATRRVVRDIAGLDAADRAEMDKALTDAPYFAAHAVGEGGAYGWARGFSSRAAAAAAAVAICGTHGRGCRVVAEVLPQGEGVDAPGTLNFDQAEAWRRAAAGFGTRAFARSADGAWAYARGDDVARAEAEAIRLCDEGRNREPELPQMPCEVVDRWDGSLLPPPGR